MPDPCLVFLTPVEGRFVLLPVKLHFLRLSLPLSLPVSAAQLEGSLGRQVAEELGQSARLLRWSLTAVEGEKAWVEVVATTDDGSPDLD